MTNSLMNEKIKKDIIGWDFVNWVQSIELFEKFLNYKNINKVLEIGASETSGGFALFFANKNLNVICSGLNDPSEKLISIHQKYACYKNIKYTNVDATNISLKEEFDIVCFKSMLGGICRGNNKRKAEIVFNQIHKVLKPNGHLVFAENLCSTWFHMYLRNRFGDTIGEKSGNWYFFSIDELIKLLEKNYEIVEYSTTGFLGCLGRNEWQKNILGYLDKYIINHIIPKKWNYIFFGIFKKIK